MILKPEIGTELKLDHPFAKMLKLGFLFNEKSGSIVYDSKSKKVSANSADWVSGGIEMITGNERVISPLPVNELPSRGTIVFEYKRTETPSTWAIIFSGDGSYNSFSFYSESGTKTDVTSYIGTTAVFDSVDALAYLSGGTHTWFFSWDDTTNSVSLHVDNDTLVDTTISFSMSSATENLAIGGRQSVSYPAEGRFSYFQVFDNVFSAAMRSRFQADPYAMWRKQSNIFYLYIPGGTVFNVTISDGFAIGDTSSAGTIFNATLSDGFASGDSVEPDTTFLASILDGITIGDSRSIETAFSVSISDGIIIGESVSAKTTFGVSVSDGFTLGDILSVLSDFSSSVSDGIDFGDTTSVSQIFESLVSDGIEFGDSAVSSVTFNVNVADGIEFGDAISAIVTFGVSVSDGITFGDSVTGTIPTDASGIVSITFSVRGTEVTFNVRKPSGTFTPRKPSITFDI